ncbi:MAG: hypothetical protein JO110_21195 [Acetobacteraceae bacterium]|nr:hypothetical protein [Acetobacteraceae bacterium]
MRMLGLVLATAMVAVAAVATVSVPKASAADLGIRHGDGTYVRLHHAHYRRLLRCPDRYSCSSLYGAYGPYGGRTYWAEYSDFVPPEYR